VALAVALAVALVAAVTFAAAAGMVTFEAETGASTCF